MRSLVITSIGTATLFVFKVEVDINVKITVNFVATSYTNHSELRNAKYRPLTVSQLFDVDSTRSEIKTFIKDDQNYQ